MAAYAAAVSLMHIIDLIKNHPSPPISLDRKQLHSLTEVVTFLQEFLEGYVSPFSDSDKADPLEMRIAEAVYAAEDVIESYIVDNIHHANDNDDNDYDDDDDAVYATEDVIESYTVDIIQVAAAAAHDEEEQIRYFNFYEGMEKAIEAMDLIKKEAMGMVRKKGGLKAQLHRSVSSSIEGKSAMVGFEDALLQLKDRLTGGDSNRHIIPLVGMGGIGKTTLARNVFDDLLIKEHFDIRVWATISQDCDIGRTLSEALGRAYSSDRSVAELGEELYKYLFGKRYLLVMDDLWSVEVWDKMKSYFPDSDCSKRSRVIVTTRMSNLASHLTNSSNSLRMSFLNQADSWTLFSNTVFGSEGGVANLELELRDIGEKIVEKCKGLPLSIVVIGGLLVKSERTQGYWEYIEENLNSIVNLENEEYCLKLLKLSYNHLPAYLKPCFLYMGVFDEDSEIKISTIIKLWVSEGFVKPKKNENLEIVAREYFQELVDRNLLLALDNDEAMLGCELGSVGNNKKFCRMHDLVRDVSLREAQKQRFYCVYNINNTPPQDTSSHRRRLVIPGNTRADYELEQSPHLRSYVCHDGFVKKFPDFRLLRTLHTNYYGTFYEYRQKDVFGLVNARMLAITLENEYWFPRTGLHSSISRLWSLHTLIVYSKDELEGPVEFWHMHQLKHVEFTNERLRLQLPPTNNDNNIVILENLEVLIGMADFHLNEDVVRRLPNLTVLGVHFGEKMNLGQHCLSYLQRLSKLESFRCSIQDYSDVNLQKICFPHSLKQILLIDDFLYTHIAVEDVLQKIGQLPFVEELLIKYGMFKSHKWETTKGQFPRLKTLELMGCHRLKKWTVSETSHFPLLQKLALYKLTELEEIPSEIGEIATLKLIEVQFCSDSAAVSAKKIVEEQEDFHGEERLSFCVQVEAYAAYHGEVLKSLASPNFQVKLY